MKIQTAIVSCIALLGFAISSSCQELKGPVWNTTQVSLVTAKIREVLDKNVKEETFKDCRISFETVGGQPVSMTIDLPDRFYIKDGEVYSVKYEKDQEKETISYTVISGKRLASVIIYLTEFLQTPEKILVTYTEDSTKKPLRTRTFALMEIKE